MFLEAKSTFKKNPLIKYPFKASENKATPGLFFQKCVAGSGWHRAHMHHPHCNYWGILNTGLAQLTEDIKAEARAWVNPPEHGRSTYPLHTHSKMITELPPPQTRQEQRQANTLGKGGRNEEWGWPLLAAVKKKKSRRGEKKEEEKKKGGRKEIAAIRAVLPRLNCMCILTVGEKTLCGDDELLLPASSVSH